MVEERAGASAEGDHGFLMRSVSDVSHEVCAAKPNRMRNAQPFRIA